MLVYRSAPSQCSATANRKKLLAGESEHGFIFLPPVFLSGTPRLFFPRCQFQPTDRGVLNVFGLCGGGEQLEKFLGV